MVRKEIRKNKNIGDGKLKILAAGDLHGDSSIASKLADRAEKEKADLVILAGDITSHIDTDNLIKPFKDKGKKVFLVPGNWDSIATVDFLADLYEMKNIHGYAIMHKGLGIFGSGGTPSGENEEKELFDTLKRGNESLDTNEIDKKIMVTHMHGENTKSEFSGFKGSKGIRKAIEELQPDLLIHSHIHEAEGIEEKIGNTRVINVGRYGKIINIDSKVNKRVQ